MARADYRDWITEDGLLMIEGWARQGLTEEQIAKNIGCAYSTFKNWKKRQVAILAALKKGKAPVDFEVENALLKSALGFEYEEKTIYTDISEEGEETSREVTVKKYMPPNTTAQIFWLKNRMPEVWRDKRNVDLENKVTVEDNSERFRQYLRALDGGSHDDGAMGEDSST